MKEEQPDQREVVRVALDILAKQWGLSTRLETIARLLEEKDKTLIQVAARRVKLGATKGTIQELEDNEK
jgi:hypothetical protein